MKGSESEEGTQMHDVPIKQKQRLSVQVEGGRKRLGKSRSGGRPDRPQVTPLGRVPGTLQMLPLGRTAENAAGVAPRKGGGERRRCCPSGNPGAGRTGRRTSGPGAGRIGRGTVGPGL